MEPKFDPTKPVQTRDGKEARVYAVHTNQSFAIHGAYYEGSWRIHGWQMDGKDAFAGNALDLINIPEEREVWVNIYKGKDTYSRYAYFSREEALTDKGKGCIACVKVKFKIGEGLE